MRILILSFYFRPDLSAGSFRTTALVEALLASRPDLEIEVITTFPNRYRGFTSAAPEREQSDRLTVTRIPLPQHRSGMADQAFAFLHFARGTRRLARGKHYDLIYATSSRLMTAALGAWISRTSDSPLYLDIRDIFADTIGDVLGGGAPVARPAFGALERWALGRAASVNLVSGGFKDYFERRIPAQRFTYFTNGVDDEFVDLSLPERRQASAEPPTVLYAGNIGEGQGLHRILPDLARHMAGRVRFRVVGDGGRRDQLMQSLRDTPAASVEVLPPVGRDRLIKEYGNADILFLHLNDYQALHKVLPSKLFEYAATGKPIWAGVGGYSAAFAIREIENAAVFPPCDVAAAESAFLALRPGLSDRSAFVSKYARRSIMKGMAADIVAVASGGEGEGER